MKQDKNALNMTDSALKSNAVVKVTRNIGMSYMRHIRFCRSNPMGAVIDKNINLKYKIASNLTYPY